MDKTELMKEIEGFLKNDETIQYKIDTGTIKNREIFRIYFDGDTSPTLLYVRDDCKIYHFSKIYNAGDLCILIAKNDYWRVLFNKTNPSEIIDWARNFQPEERIVFSALYLAYSTEIASAIKELSKEYEIEQNFHLEQDIEDFSSMVEYEGYIITYFHFLYRRKEYYSNYVILALKQKVGCAEFSAELAFYDVGFGGKDEKVSSYELIENCKEQVKRGIIVTLEGL